LGFLDGFAPADFGTGGNSRETSFENEVSAKPPYFSFRSARSSRLTFIPSVTIGGEVAFEAALGERFFGEVVLFFGPLILGGTPPPLTKAE